GEKGGPLMAQVPAERGGKRFGSSGCHESISHLGGRRPRDFTTWILVGNPKGMPRLAERAISSQLWARLVERVDGESIEDAAWEREKQTQRVTHDKRHYRPCCRIKPE